VLWNRRDPILIASGSGCSLGDFLSSRGQVLRQVSVTGFYSTSQISNFPLPPRGRLGTSVAAHHQTRRTLPSPQFPVSAGPINQTNLVSNTLITVLFDFSNIIRFETSILPHKILQNVVTTTISDPNQPPQTALYLLVRLTTTRQEGSHAPSPTNLIPDGP
jgi:hypothetical protein